MIRPEAPRTLGNALLSLWLMAFGLFWLFEFSVPFGNSFLAGFALVTGFFMFLGLR